MGTAQDPFSVTQIIPQFLFTDSIANSNIVYPLAAWIRADTKAIVFGLVVLATLPTKVILMDKYVLLVTGNRRRSKFIRGQRYFTLTKYVSCATATKHGSDNGLPAGVTVSRYLNSYNTFTLIFWYHWDQTWYRQGLHAGVIVVYLVPFSYLPLVPTGRGQSRAALFR